MCTRFMGSGSEYIVQEEVVIMSVLGNKTIGRRRIDAINSHAGSKIPAHIC